MGAAGQCRGASPLLTQQAAQLFRDAAAQRTHGVLDSVLSRTELHAQFAALRDAHGHPRLTPADCAVLERYLERDEGVLVTEGDLVKLVAHGAPRTVSEADRGVFSVREMHRKLTAQVDELEARVQQAHARIVQALRTKQPEASAKAYLRTKKQLEELLTKRVGALETVHSLLLQMEQAVGDAEIVRTYETSAATLRTILADPALQPARVDATMDALAESVEQSDEVHATLTSHAAPVDDDEIAHELEQLALDARDEQAEQAEAAEAPPDVAKQPEAAKQPEMTQQSEPAKQPDVAQQPEAKDLAAMRSLPSAPQHTPSESEPRRMAEPVATTEASGK